MIEFLNVDEETSIFIHENGHSPHLGLSDFRLFGSLKDWPKLLKLTEIMYMGKWQMKIKEKK